MPVGRRPGASHPGFDEFRQGFAFRCEPVIEGVRAAVATALPTLKSALLDLPLHPEMISDREFGLRAVGVYRPARLRICFSHNASILLAVPEAEVTAGRALPPGNCSS